MKLRILESVLIETLEDIKKYYPNIDDDTFMELIALDPTYTGKDSAGKYGKWLLNLYNRGKLSKTDFGEVTPLLNQFKIYRNRIQNKDLNSYKTLDELAETLASVINDMSMLTPSQKTKFLKRVKSGKITVDKSDDFEIVLDTPNFTVYVPNTHEASMKLGKGTKWCTAHEEPKWYNHYTEEGHKLYIIRDKKTGDRWQYSDKTDDFLNQEDKGFNIFELMKRDEKLSKFFESLLGIDLINNSETWIYDGNYIPKKLVKYITKVIVSPDVTEIDHDAFHDCINLKDVSIPDSVNYIGRGAFYNCQNLRNVKIPKSVEYILSTTFTYCYSLENVIIPEGVKYIGSSAFSECSNLTNITLPSSVVSIDSYAFNNCKNLTNVMLSDGVTTIERDAFAQCIKLANINVPNSVTSIKVGAFQHCVSLKRLSLPKSITFIGWYAFENCKNLTIYTDNEYVNEYCNEYNIQVKPLSAKNESYIKSNKLRLQIRE